MLSCYFRLLVSCELNNVMICSYTFLYRVYVVTLLCVASCYFLLCKLYCFCYAIILSYHTSWLRCYSSRYYVVLCNMLWCGIIWCGVVWCGMVRYGMARYGMARYGMVWYGMARYGMVWYSIVMPYQFFFSVGT